MDKVKICHWCGKEMTRCEDKVAFQKNGKPYVVPNAVFFRCEHCGEKIFEAEEARRIDAMLRVQPLFE